MITSYLHPGKMLGSRYQLEQLLGTGQFGQVWRAKRLDSLNPSTVALKLPLQPGIGETALMADAQYMLAVPRHPGIVTVWWQGRVGDFWVVEMELINGLPLSAMMMDASRWASVTFEDMIHWFMGLADAVGHLHINNILHGDIKPDNLLLDEPSNTLKITDFGTSRRLTDLLMKTSRHGGAWAYQAPEIQQAHERGIPSDLFSLGAVLYHMTTGRLPRGTIHELLTTAPITRPRQYNPDIPEDLEAIIEALLRDDPRKRIQSALGLLESLKAVSNHTGARLPEVSKPALAMGYLDRANELIKTNKLEEAREAAAQASLHSTGLVTALELFARLSDKLGYTDDAIKSYERILILNSLDIEARKSIALSLSDILLRVHRYEDAQKYIETCLVEGKAAPDIRFRSAIIAGACGNLKESLRILDELEKEDWNVGAALEKKAWALWLMHHYDESAEVCRKVIADMPDNMLCLKRLAEYETLLGNTRRAQIYEERVVRLSA